jgi:hypothetical protein
MNSCLKGGLAALFRLRRLPTQQAASEWRSLPPFFEFMKGGLVPGNVFLSKGTSQGDKVSSSYALCAGKQVVQRHFGSISGKQSAL